MFNLLLKTMSPAKGFELVKLHLESQIGFEPVKFDILADAKTETVKFVVYDEQRFPEKGKHTYISDMGKKFMKVAIDYIKNSEQVPKGSTIDKSIVTCYPEGVTAYLFFEHEGVKGTLKKVLQ